MTKPAAKVSQVRVVAVQLVHDIGEKGLYANLALENVLRSSSMDPADRRLVTGIVNGTIRMIRHLDWVLNLFLNKKIEGQNPWLKSILRVSAYQILFMDRIPAHAAVNDAVELTRIRLNPALSKVTNGVLRNMIRHQEDIRFPDDSPAHYLAIYYSHPEWLVELYLGMFGRDGCEKILAYDNLPPAVVLRVNTQRITREGLLERLRDEGVFAAPGRLHPQAVILKDIDRPLTALSSFNEGLFYVQNEASMLAASILNPTAGDFVYDFCCGVGGKSTHMAELMQDNGSIEAFDLYEHKIGLALHNCRRLNLEIIKPQPANILALDLTRRADRILLDAPCSGWGVLNRRSDSRWHMSQEEITELKQLQLALLAKAAEGLAEHGELLYATCTINPSENEQVIERFLENHEFEIQGFADRINFFPLDEADRQAAAGGQLTILPGKYGSDGMFYALLRRKSFCPM
ncbi:MAG: 16S rRNA (cytosine(967)-C(5))-methyltransferase RsmB [Deltaproteobacteria bacterium]